jgi:tetratricopeptide (TPR) repeat protein
MDPGTTGPAAYNAMGHMHLRRMEYAEAREAFQKSLEIDKLNGGARNGLATILIEEGKLDEAAAELEIAARFLPNNISVLSTLAGLHNKRQEYEEGMALARRALEINENFVQALNNLGSALRATGDLDGAREQFQKVLARDPGYVPCMINLAGVYLSEGMEEKAVELYLRTLEVNPRQPQALFNVASFKMHRGQPEEAADYYRRAIAADPDYARAHQHFGVLLYMQGQRARALEHLERSLELDPMLSERERIRSLVESLRVTLEPGQPRSAPARPDQP